MTMHMQALRTGAILLNGSYRIERILGHGGYGITYLATDISLQRKVAIKEFFLKDLCQRDEDTNQVTPATSNSKKFVSVLKAKFLKEARNIAKLNHPGIIRIHAAFEENGTAYYVMEYIEGKSLSEMVKRNGPMGEERALRYAVRTAEILSYIHDRRINHLDVKPANIMIRHSADSPILIDFGLSKHYDTEGNQTSSTPLGISHGYAPLEQYSASGIKEFSPQADIYSLAATLYYLLTGSAPPQAMTLVDEALSFPPGISARVADAITHAMAPRHSNRPRTAAEFIRELEKGSAKDQLPSPGHGIISPHEPDSSAPRGPRPRMAWIAISAAMLAIGGAGAYFWLDKNPDAATAVAADVMEPPASGEINGHSFVDLGLPSGIKWATCNLGAVDPSDYGDYYAWGETAPKSSYKKANSRTYGKDMAKLRAKGIVGHTGNLSPDYDAAQVNWGASWRMPTNEEITELFSQCSWTWTAQDGHNGHVVTGPNGSSIFIPASGYCNNTSPSTVGECRVYWSSTPSEDNDRYAFNLGNIGVNRGLRFHGFPIRPVTE